MKKFLVQTTALLFLASSFSLPLYAGAEPRTSALNNEVLFKQAVFEMRDLYQPILDSMPLEMGFVPQWDKTAVDSYTILGKNGRRMVFINGGIARARHMTRDALMLVVCHELGHNLGGYPQKPYIGGEPWSSAEGQSDYYAAAKCLKRYFDEYYVDLADDPTPSHPEILDRCRRVYGQGSRSYNICVRTVKAGEAIIRALSQEYLGHTNQSVTKPSIFVTDETNLQYPSMQCRLDTYFRGALCDIDPDSDEYCTESYKSYGARPKCWYKP